MKILKSGLFACLLLLLCCQYEEPVRSGWQGTTFETKPWSRWWWQGNALTKEGITAEMEAYQKAGIGGLEITPIYGVVGYEDKFVNFLSPQWMGLLMHTLKEAKRLDMGIDMATGTGWPFGGPWVKAEFACKNMNVKTYEMKEGEKLKEPIKFIQEPYLRAIGNPVFQESRSASEMKVALKGDAPIMRLDPKSISIKQLREPVSANKNLQALALEQIKFERPLALKALMAYETKGEVIDLTSKVSSSGELQWMAPSGTWKLYAVFEGWHGKMVERAGPGGEGDVIDHFSGAALKHYLDHFDSAFAGNDISSLRAFFNDSYEVDDARGVADWTPDLFEEFNKRRGYDLRKYLPALFSKEDQGINKRILCDYRETISDLLLDNFTQPWKSWAHGKSAIVRNQAHGSPSNILDLYATVDIPEIEGIEPLRIKMASSAANVTGKKLVSSESATWLNEHFQSNLGDIKIAVDRFMLNGVNHIFYHGTNYSPPGEPWPGWLFYAAVHLNPRNSLWKDFKSLNQYVTRCQSFLQNSAPDNEVLLYYPIADPLSNHGREMLDHFDGITRQFANTPFERSATALLSNGYTFDYISDKQICNIQMDHGNLRTEGEAQYKTLVIPHSQYIPIKTLEKIISLAEGGATIIMAEGIPDSTSGFANFADHEKRLQKFKNDFRTSMKERGNGVFEMKTGKGRVLSGTNINSLISFTDVRRESMTDSGLGFIRKKGNGDRTLYFISNNTARPFEGWAPLNTEASFSTVYDPMNGNFGTGKIRKTAGVTEVYIQLASHQTIWIELSKQVSQQAAFPYYSPAGSPIPLNGKWLISFDVGGPSLPTAIETDSLQSWTNFRGTEYQSFSGTATYATAFDKPSQPVLHWMLDLGSVKESAEVLINGHPVGTAIGPVYQLYFESTLLRENNLIEVKVSNLMANRISDLDKRKVLWKKFYNVNFPARLPANRKNGIFDASDWQPHNSGLLGPVYLVPMETK